MLAAPCQQQHLITRPYVVVFALIFLAYLVPFFVKKESEWEKVYVPTAAHLAAGDDIYAQKHGFVYPPSSALFALPFLLMPGWLCRLSWYALNIAAFWVFVNSAWRLVGGGRLDDRRQQAIFLLGLGCAILYTFHALAHQQIDLVMAGLTLAGCLAWREGRPLLGGAIIGVAAGLKATPLLFLVYFVLKRQWRAAAALIVAAVAVNLAVDLIHPEPTGTTWLGCWVQRFLMPMTAAKHRPGVWASDILYNQSLSGFWNRLLLTTWSWGPDGVSIVARTPATVLSLRYLAFGSMLLTSVACWWFVLRKSAARHEPVELAALLCLMPLLSPMSSIPHFWSLLPAGFLVAQAALATRSKLLWAILSAALVCSALCGKDPLGHNLYTLVLWHGDMTIHALALLLGCAVVRRQLNRPDSLEPGLDSTTSLTLPLKQSA